MATRPRPYQVQSPAQGGGADPRNELVARIQGAQRVHSGRSYSNHRGFIEGGLDPFTLVIPLTDLDHAEGTDDSNVNHITFIFEPEVDLAIDSIELR